MDGSIVILGLFRPVVTLDQYDTTFLGFEEDKIIELIQLSSKNKVSLV